MDKTNVQYEFPTSSRREEHLMQWLATIQGVCNKDMPDGIIEQIEKELNRFTYVDINKQTIKEILRKLKLHKYYGQIPYIFHRITGLPTPYFPPVVVDTLTIMYKEIKANYSSFSPPSTSYIIYKLLEILGEKELMTHIPLLKSREKMCRQDAHWKEMCEYHGWKFIPTIGCEVEKISE